MKMTYLFILCTLGIFYHKILQIKQQQQMTRSTEESQVRESHNGVCANSKPILSRQTSWKRHNSQNEKENDIDDIRIKRGRNTTFDYISCPLAHMGCRRDLHQDHLQEHYLTAQHQECVTKCTMLCLEKLHVEPKAISTLLNNDEKYSQVMESVNLLAEGLSVLNDDNTQIHSNQIQIQNSILEQQNQIDQLKNSIEESVKFSQATQINSRVLETDIESIKQRVSDLSSPATNDGTFIWKITDVAEKMNDSISEKQTSIYSPPFYTSPNGYKMCMRLYFNGDGQARKSHLSIFFVLLRGDYDAILSWPFCFKITFCLYDQTNNQNHIIDSFRPDIKSNSFQRPRSNMNIASGLPKFCPLTMIQTSNNPYVRDDCMFIRCMIEFESLSKLAIRQICKINVALPKTIQQKLIQEEIERVNTPQTSVSIGENMVTSNEKLNVS
ncbi:unnamed protein product [Rotaria socialis]|uniref:MATH domain-containing protein n=2 Tax=Rotaria socialis TaxID=392032 RepID=A0A818B5W7_9BILA|nr:unnamed protein product [Rotaria socialis]CAF3476234.1 unnamed protein product [Rotaria socialis]CAF3492523.1 unnamed protein product [Rotaria socialis]